MKKFILLRALTALITAALLFSSLVSCGGEEAAVSPSDAAAGRVSFFEDQAVEESLDAFLDTFTRWYAVRPGEKWSYDSESAADGRSNILACIATPASCAEWKVYSDFPEEDCFVEKTNDPKKWAKDTYAYYVYDADTIDFIAKEIFNISEEDLKTLIKSGSDEKAFYRHKGKYYTLYEGVFDSFVNAEITSVTRNGDRYIVGFDFYRLSETYDEDGIAELESKCIAEMELKTIDGKEYWSLYRFDSEENKE
jgi:hypothetical protein